MAATSDKASSHHPPASSLKKHDGNTSVSDVGETSHRSRRSSRSTEESKSEHREAHTRHRSRSRERGSKKYSNRSKE